MFGERLKLLREGKEFTQEQLGKRINLTKANISKYENEGLEPNIDTMIMLADLFNTSVDYLLGRIDTRAIVKASTLIPLLGTIRAGLPLLAEENSHYEIEVPSDLKADFALKVTGDSMSWAGICDGDIAVMKQSNTPSHGMVVAAGIEDGDWQATLKFYVEEKGTRLLRAANPEYSDIILNGHYKIIGHVVQILKEPPSLADYRQALTSRVATDENWQDVIMSAAKHGLSAQQVNNMIEIMLTASQRAMRGK